MPGVMPSVVMGHGADARASNSHHMQSSVGLYASKEKQTTAGLSSPTEGLLNGDSLTHRNSISNSLQKPLVTSPRAPPSYLAISCAISGYSSINRYDSAVREGFRSRDSSPAPPRLAFARSRDSSPLRERLKSPEARSTPQETAVRISELKAQLARCARELGGELEQRHRQNSIRRRDKKPPTGRSVSVDRGYLTKASHITTGASSGYRDGGAGSGYRDGGAGSGYRDGGAGSGYRDGGAGSGYRDGGAGSGYRDGGAGSGYRDGGAGSGYRDGGAGSGYRDGGGARYSGYTTTGSSAHYQSGGGTSPYGGQQHYSSGNMTSHQIPVRLLDGQQNFNGHLGSPLTLHSRTIDNNIATRSFIQERIERLYGPAALAAGFIKKSPSQLARNTAMGNTVKRTPNTRTSNTEGRIIPIQLEYNADELDSRKPIEPVQGLPSVFRHLRPEFRQQLPVKSPVSGSSKLIMKRSDSTESNGNIPCDLPTEVSPQSRPAASIVPSPSPVQSVTINGASTNGHIKQTKLIKDTNALLSSISDVPKLNGDSKTVWANVPEVVARNAVNTESHASSPVSAASELRPKVAPPVAEVATPAVSKVTPTSDGALGEGKDGHYYLKEVATCVARLEAEVAVMDAELRQHSAQMNEEVRGNVFVATGKTKLLISQKIKQFTGLCHKNIAGQQGDDEFPTTPSDLAGFWDMVSLQVEDVLGLLADLRLIRDNRWRELPAPDVVDSVTKAVTAKPRRVKAAPSAATKAKDEARKKMVEERRKAMRDAMKAKKAAAETSASGQDEVEIFVPDK